MAIGALLFVVLAIDALVLAMPRGDGMIHTGSAPMPAFGGPDAEMATLVPLAADERAAVGVGAARVEVGIERAGDTIGVAGDRYVVFTAHFQNTGSVPIRVGIVAEDSSVETGGLGHPAVAVHGVGEPVLGPGWATGQEVTFKVPQFADLTGLHLVFRLNDTPFAADWNLGPGNDLRSRINLDSLLNSR